MKERRRGTKVFIIFLAAGLLFAMGIIRQANGAGPVQQTPNVTPGRVNPQLPAVSSGTVQPTLPQTNVTSKVDLIPTMFDRIGKLEQDMAAVQQKLSDQEQKLAAVQQKLSDQEQKLAAQQQAFSQLKDANAKHVHEYKHSALGGMQISLLGFKQILENNANMPGLIQIIDATHPVGTTTEVTGPPK